MKVFVAFVLLVAIKCATSIPIEETEDYKKSRIEYDALIAKLNATDPCQLIFCNEREECVNFPKCKPGEICPLTKCVPRKLCESTICPPYTECAEFDTTLYDLDEHKYGFLPRINYKGDTEGVKPTCVSRKVPSAGNICGVNEEIDKRASRLAISEKTCSIKSAFGLVQPLGGPYVTYCVCNSGYVRDDINGECIHESKCPNYKEPTKRPGNYVTGKPISKTTKFQAGKAKVLPKLVNMDVSDKLLGIGSTKNPFAQRDFPKVNTKYVKIPGFEVPKNPEIPKKRPCPNCVFGKNDNEQIREELSAKPKINAEDIKTAEELRNRITNPHVKLFTRKHKAFTGDSKIYPTETLIGRPTKLL